MTLSRSSAYHYWSSRYGVLPVIGGKPTFARNSAGVVGDARGELYSAIINTPRFAWETDKSVPSLERRAALLIEQGRVNIVPNSINWGASSWLVTAMTVATGFPDPMGGTNACRLTATGGFSQIYQNLGPGTTQPRVPSCWMRRVTGGATVELNTSQDHTNVVALTSLWQRFSATEASNSTTRIFDVLLGASGDQIDVYNAVMEEAPAASADIVNPAASLTSRAVDNVGWAFPSACVPIVVYSKHVDRGAYAIANASQTPRLWALEGAGATTPRVTAYQNGVTANLLHQNAGGSTSAGVTVGAMGQGDVLETLSLITPAGVYIASSLNGAAIVTAAGGGALAFGPAWAGPLTMGIGSSVLDPTGAAFLDLRILKYGDLVNAGIGQAMLDEVRGFELGPSGDVL